LFFKTRLFCFAGAKVRLFLKLTKFLGTFL